MSLRSHVLPFLLVGACVGVFAGEPDTSPIYDVPKLSDITVDGKPDDWKEDGLRADVLADTSGTVKPSNNFSSVFRLGWNDEGLLVLATIKDDIFLEPAAKKEELWKGDSVELFVALTRGGDSYQVVIAPGMDPKSAEVRDNLSDYRKNAELKKKTKLTIKRERTKIDGGYILEVLLPWKNLDIEPADGREIGFQFYANDTDKEGERYQALWFPQAEANADSSRMQRLKLAAKASPAVKVAAYGTLQPDGHGTISLVGVGEMKGKKVKIKDGDLTVGEGQMEAAGDRATAKIELSKRPAGYGVLTIALDDAVITTMKLAEPKAPTPPAPLPEKK